MNEKDITSEDNQQCGFRLAWLCRLTVGALLVFAFTVGVFAAGLGLRDPDTCWLLALGDWIAEHRALPQTDPFSYTYALFHPGKAPVLYQWLTELAFHFVHKLSGLTGLVVLLAAVLAYAFICLPLAQLRRSSVPDVLAIALTCLTVLSTSFHFLARPEIFSYLFLGLWIELILQVDSGPKSQPAILAAAALMMILWCNFHSGFALGLTVLVVYVACRLTAKPAPGAGKGSQASLLIKLLCCSVLATALNPWGVRLWRYLPELFFMPFNGRIVELRSLSVADLSEFTYYPYIALTALVASLMLWRCRSIGWRSVGLFPLLTAFGWAAAGLCCRRLIPFSALLMLAAVSCMYRQVKMAAPANVRLGQPSLSCLLSGWSRALKRYYDPTSAVFNLSVPLLAMLGAYMVALNVVALRLPQSSSAFRPPVEAVKFLARAGLSGRLFNDAQFGDLIIWQLGKQLPVFIDTRYDMYGERLIADYLRIISATDNWRELVDSYAIDLVFVSASDRLSSELKTLPGWRELYRDELAVIAQRGQSK